MKLRVLTKAGSNLKAIKLLFIKTIWSNLPLIQSTEFKSFGGYRFLRPLNLKRHAIAEKNLFITGV